MNHFMHCKPKCFVIQYSLKIYSNKEQEVFKLWFAKGRKQKRLKIWSRALSNTVA